MEGTLPGAMADGSDTSQCEVSPDGHVVNVERCEIAQALRMAESRIVEMWPWGAPAGHFYVAVTGLRPEEITEEFGPGKRAAPIFVSRSYSRGEVDALAAKLLPLWPESITAVTPYYAQGAIGVTTRTAEGQSAIATTIHGITGVVPLTGDAARDATREMWEGGPAQIPDSPRIALVGVGTGDVNAMEVLPADSVGFATKTVAKAVSARVRVGSKAKVKVRVTSGAENSRPAGTLMVTWRGGSKKVTLRPHDKGKKTVVLGRLPRGTHSVRVSYKPSPASPYAPSKAKRTRLTVT
jgi:hypothetical protein